MMVTAAGDTSWRVEFDGGWYVVDADGVRLAGPFDDLEQVEDWLDRNVPGGAN
jgi:hypothetical protein